MLTPEDLTLKLSPRHEDTISQAVIDVSKAIVRDLLYTPMNSTTGTDIRSARSQREAMIGLPITILHCFNF